jgi:hypothetical protein
MPALASSDEILASYVQRLQHIVDPRAASALVRMDDPGRQLLAARAYVRAGDLLPQRWSWSRAKIERFHGSSQQEALLAEIDRVRKAFEQQNPGYTLFVNERVRSVEEQLTNWNSNASVGAAAANLQSSTIAFLAAAGWPPPDRVIDRLVEFLGAHVPEPTPTLAAPGLSPHGQMNAVDFHIYRGDEEIATPDAATIASVWDAQGWGERLGRAVRDSGARFTGPLASPREPWHYHYDP